MPTPTQYTQNAQQELSAALEYDKIIAGYNKLKQTPQEQGKSDSQVLNDTLKAMYGDDAGKKAEEIARYSDKARVAEIGENFNTAKKVLLENNLKLPGNGKFPNARLFGEERDGMRHPDSGHSMVMSQDNYQDYVKRSAGELGSGIDTMQKQRSGGGISKEQSQALKSAIGGFQKAKDGLTEFQANGKTSPDNLTIADVGRAQQAHVIAASGWATEYIEKAPKDGPPGERFTMHRINDLGRDTVHGNAAPEQIMRDARRVDTSRLTPPAPPAPAIVPDPAAKPGQSATPPAQTGGDTGPGPASRPAESIPPAVHNPAIQPPSGGQLSPSASADRSGPSAVTTPQAPAGAGGARLVYPDGGSSALLPIEVSNNTQAQPGPQLVVKPQAGAQGTPTAPSEPVASPGKPFLVPQPGQPQVPVADAAPGKPFLVPKPVSAAPTPGTLQTGAGSNGQAPVVAQTPPAPAAPVAGGNPVSAAGSQASGDAISSHSKTSTGVTTATLPDTPAAPTPHAPEASPAATHTQPAPPASEPSARPVESANTGSRGAGAGAGLALGTVGLVEAIKHHDGWGGLVSGTSVATSAAELRIVLKSAGEITPELENRLGTLGKANVILTVVNGTVQISREDGMNHKTQRAAAVTLVASTGALAGTLGGGLLSTVALPAVVGYTADKTIDVVRAREGVNNDIAAIQPELKTHSHLQVEEMQFRTQLDAAGVTKDAQGHYDMTSESNADKMSRILKQHEADLQKTINANETGKYTPVVTTSQAEMLSRKILAQDELARTQAAEFELADQYLKAHKDAAAAMESSAHLFADGKTVSTIQPPAAGVPVPQAQVQR